MDHLVCISTNVVVDLGAITPFFVVFRAREEIYDLLDSVCGARLLTVSYVRIGGSPRTCPTTSTPAAEDLDWIREVADQMENLLTRGTRSSGTGSGCGCDVERRRSVYGWVGPYLRGSGVATTSARDHPYSGYDQYDFDARGHGVGDCHDRYLVRVEEIKRRVSGSSSSAGEASRSGFITTTWQGGLPPKSEVYSNIESPSNHFKFVYDGILAEPGGRWYREGRGSNGELGYYIVEATGRSTPRQGAAPCYNIYQAYPEMIREP